MLLLFGPVTLLSGLKCDISLLFDEWRICLVVRLWTTSDRHAPDPLLWLFHSHRCGSPLRLPLEVHQSRTHLKLWHKQQCEESAHDYLTERTVWMGLVLFSKTHTIVLMPFFFTTNNCKANSFKYFVFCVFYIYVILLLLTILAAWLHFWCITTSCKYVE